MAIGDFPSYSAAERLIYGLPPQKTIDAAGAVTSGAKQSIGPYTRHSYQVTSNASAVGKFNIYGCNDTGTALIDYQLIAQYSISPATNPGGLLYSDEFLFEYAYCSINPWTGGVFDVVEKHSP